MEGDTFSLVAKKNMECRSHCVGQQGQRKRLANLSSTQPFCRIYITPLFSNVSGQLNLRDL